MGGVADAEFEGLRKENKRLSEENNMLNLKIDILVDMVNTK